MEELKEKRTKGGIFSKNNSSIFLFKLYFIDMYVFNYYFINHDLAYLKIV
jgi:hypothetical protein